MWTKSQSDAIYAPIGDLLVTAAAGSGKTAVMVERIINRIVGDNPTDVDRMLVVTYTNAAATEIKERIMNEIIKKLDEKEDDNLKKQLVLMNNASICTIHSFCLDVVRSNFNILGIDPNVKIGNASDLQIYMQKALDIVMERHYDTQDEDFIALVRAYSGKTDSAVSDMILKLYNFSRSIPNPEKWLDGLVLDRDNITQKFLPVLKNKVISVCSLALQNYNKILRLCNSDAYLSGFVPFFEEEMAPLARVCDKMSWDELYDCLNAMEFKKLVVKQDKCSEMWLADAVKNARNDAKESVKKVLAQILNAKLDDILSDMCSQNMYISKLVELTYETADEYTAIKKEKSVIDFSDFEHLCLKALSNNGTQSEAAVEIMNRFDEIYIDEYQDCNSVQEEIFKLISGANKGKPNIFAVGDMKQSIYKFRDANPALIKEKSNMFPQYNCDAPQDRSKITLNMNFRSRPEVLDCVNTIFSQIMSENAGELDYNSDEFLYYGSNSYKDVTPDFKMCDVVLIDSASSADSGYFDEDESETEDFGSVSCEAVYIANRIKSMINDPQYKIYDKKTDSYRHIEYRDIVILMRSVRSCASDFAEIFECAGIPLFTDVKGYFDSEEITFVMDLLRIIDNPLDDIPLAAVMRHPVIGFSENELMQIRSFLSHGSYYDALCSAADSKWKSAGKCRWFLSYLGRAYEKSKYLSINELMSDILDEIGYTTYLATLPNAETAKSNIKMLFYKAKNFENNNFRGIFNFVNYVELLKSRGNDTDSAKTLGENDNVVRIMTIHKSKGLEFPVVFLARCGSRFNKQDLSGNVLMHKTLGIGMKNIDMQRRVKYSTAAREAIKIQTDSETVSEELRVLYVALTRAREKLIVTSYVNNAKSIIKKTEQLIKNQGKVISGEIVINCNSYLQWILMAVLRCKSCTLSQEIFDYVSDNKYFSCNIVEENKLSIQKQQFTQCDIDSMFSDAKLEDIYSRLSFEYPFAQLSIVPRNLSVTELKRMSMEETEDSGKLFYPEHIETPLFLKGDSALTGAHKGTVMHKVMQYIDFTDNDIHSQLQSMVTKGYISQKELQVVNVAAIEKFINSPMGMRIRENYSSLCREFSFKYMMKAAEIFPQIQSDDDIIVQGVVDAFFENNDGSIVIIDYKTDKIRKSSADIADKYRTQLKYYSIALEKLLGKPVSQTYIHLFDNGETIKL